MLEHHALICNMLLQRGPKIIVPPALATLTMRPFVFLSCGKNALVTDTIPQRLTSRTCFISSTVCHSIRPTGPIPALFTIAHKPKSTSRHVVLTAKNTHWMFTAFLGCSRSAKLRKSKHKNKRRGNWKETFYCSPTFSQITHLYFCMHFAYRSSLLSESLEQATAFQGS